MPGYANMELLMIGPKTEVKELPNHPPTRANAPGPTAWPFTPPRPIRYICRDKRGKEAMQRERIQSKHADRPGKCSRTVRCARMLSAATAHLRAAVR